MKKLFCFLAALLILLAACGGDTDDMDSMSADPTPTDVVAEEAPTEPAATATLLSTPVDVPEPTQGPALITSAEDMEGIWLGKVAGESGYVMYTPDGRYLVALSQGALATTPRVAGEYWFEDGQIHMRDLENAGHWAACDSETVGVYDVVDLGDGQVAFQMVDDSCGDSGFTRGYVFTNMTQEWIAEPVEVVVPQSAAVTMPELAAAHQAIADAWVNENGAPGVILLFDAQDMDFTWQGVASMSMLQEEAPLLPGDQFTISSMTKMITAATVMKLVEQGDLALDDPISLYLPAETVSQLLVLDGDSCGEAITVRQLLNHTSGLGDFSNGEDADGNGLPVPDQSRALRLPD